MSRRVVIIGGAGAVGRSAASHLLSRGVASSVVLADSDVRRARSVAESLGAGVSWVGVDADDGGQLASVLKDVDAALVATPGVSGRGVVEVASLEAGTHLVDVCDDLVATEATLDMHGEFATAHLTAVVGMGASPGIMNLIAMEAASVLDRVDRLVTAVRLDIDGEGDPVSNRLDGSILRHWVRGFDREAAVVRDGERLEAPTFTRVDLDVAGERGAAWVTRRPEAVSLASTIGGSIDATSVLLGSPLTISLLADVQHDLRSGWLTPEQAMAEVSAPSARRRSRAVHARDRYSTPGRLPGFFAQVTGEADGVRRRATCVLNGLPAGPDAVAVPAVLCLEQVLEGAVAPGAHMPHEAVNRARLLDGVASYCDDLTGGLYDLMVEEAQERGRSNSPLVAS